MHALTLPRLGQTMETGRIVEWLVEEGAAYAEGAPIYSIETDKTVLEVQATLAGTLLRKLAAPEDEVPVGKMVAVVADPGEQPADEAIRRFIVERESTDASGVEPRAAEHAKTSESPSERTEADQPRAPKAMPRTKRVAREHGVDLARITDPSGPDGLITEADVLRYAQSSAVKAPTPAPTAQSGGGERKARSAIERTIARQMTRSWAVPQFSQDFEVDAQPLLNRRQQLTQAGVDASLTSLVLDALVAALRKAPHCNATFDGEELVEFQSVHAAIAVATDRGLLVPVLRNCEADDFAQRNRRLAQLLTRARAGALEPDEASGGTITLSNLGPSRVETGVPIINAPQVCLIFTGAIVEKPVVSGGQLAVGKRMRVVCVYDHRVIDGVAGARFVDALSEALVGR